MATTKSSLADELVQLARALESLNGLGRSAAVWSLQDEPRLLYAGPHAEEKIVQVATNRLASSEDPSFEVDGELGTRGKVYVCEVEGQRAAYGLFLHGAGHPHLATTLDQLIEEVERTIGKPVGGMTRAEKQQVVHFLDKRGVFLMRRAVEDVAGRLGVTRFTIYNYLERKIGPQTS